MIEIKRKSIDKKQWAAMFEFLDEQDINYEEREQVLKNFRGHTK
jgi:hypothetical protein